MTSSPGAAPPPHPASGRTAPPRSAVDALREVWLIFILVTALTLVYGLLCVAVLLLGGGLETAATSSIPGGPAAPALTLLGSAQAVALISALGAGAALVGALRGADSVRVASRLRATLRVLGVAHLAICAALMVIWLVLATHLWVVVLGCALVAAQCDGALLLLARRRGPFPVPSRRR